MKVRDVDPKVGTARFAHRVDALPAPCFVPVYQYADQIVP